MMMSLQRWLGANGQRLIVGIPWFWLALFFVLPFLFILKISLSEPQLAQPPYQDWIREFEDGLLTITLNFGNYLLLLEDDLYFSALMGSLSIAAVSTVICLLIGYPMAYAIALSPKHWRMPLLMLIILPFWTSFLIRVYAWIGILKDNGLLNQLLMGIGLIDEPLQMLHTPIAVYVGVVYSYLPFLVLPLYATLVRLDNTLLEAAADLGARPWRQFLTITLPQSIPGVMAGSMLVFIPVMGEFVIPDLLGGPDTLMIGKLMWTEFFSNKDWPVASSLAAILLLVLIIPFVVMRHYEQRANEEQG
ncbi:MAG: ABC transporter permease subunit [Thalassolituus sp.]|jgi:putrescine transport system permease protein|uniref:Putrescine transport protein n=1 Tax=Thalassolituus oleivorans MIL-1 TaxID=1298593 RepID=M5DMV6_9GAMM|nr:ABC transporter permease subunit [Thalassolituus oleivorans]PCI50383.1 MAG: putrescine ABC transporter permease [Oceanospirillales bacterium]AHK14798.1 putrescine/spermidine ABC transporter permease [Thalassolituus oleivorans R6-15]APR65811.1 putrescine ABC transporter permease [Thalassolituus oleivorans]MBQ0726826.1 ABC transporter permease subunit [Thalassolituus oleivorans]MBQ0781052.1 ABC transporter permease subunit [Thalassolituus oleivorans]